jgi:hypothetical protein
VRSRARALLAALLAPALIGAGAAGCDSKPRTYESRFWTDDLAFRVSMEPTPPHAREEVLFKVVVNDKKSGNPIQNGEGRIFAMNADSVQKWDGLEPGPEAGTYYAKLNFVTAGQWAIGMQFRRDSTQRLQRMDWMQEVFAERPGP